MASFMGMYRYSIDVKGRINIPSKMRKSMNPEANDTFILTRGFDKCIFIYPLDEWNELEKKVKMLSTFKEKDRYFQRSFLMWATTQELDSQSRVSIPKELLDYANIKKEVKIIGSINRIEIWDPETFNNYLQSQSESYEQIAEKVMGLE